MRHNGACCCSARNPSRGSAATSFDFGRPVISLASRSSNRRLVRTTGRRGALRYTWRMPEVRSAAKVATAIFFVAETLPTAATVATSTTSSAMRNGEAALTIRPRKAIAAVYLAVYLDGDSGPNGLTFRPSRPGGLFVDP